MLQKKNHAFSFQLFTFFLLGASAAANAAANAAVGFSIGGVLGAYNVWSISCKKEQHEKEINNLFYAISPKQMCISDQRHESRSSQEHGKLPAS